MSDAIEKQAMRLFRIVQGPGDSGSEHEFNRLNPGVADGWIRLARQSTEFKAATKVITLTSQNMQLQKLNTALFQALCEIVKCRGTKQKCRAIAGRAIAKRISKGNEV